MFGINVFKDNENAGDVYILQTYPNEKNIYKIGVTSNLITRLIQYRTESVYEPRFKFFMACKNTQLIDKLMKNKLNNIVVEGIQKNIKNVHLSVYQPTGHVKVSAPESMTKETIRVYVISKLGWIKKQQEKLRNQEREALREYIDRESHYFNGKR